MAFLPKRNDLKQQREDLRKHGMKIPLPYTSIGSDEQYEVIMRYVSAFDKSIVEAMPSDTQAKVWEGIKGIQAASRAGTSDPQSLIESVAQNAEQLHAADLLFCAAAINPKVVMTEEEAGDSDDVYPVSYFAAEDRISFLMGTLGGNQDIAKTFKLFRPKPDDDVQDSAAGGLAESPALRAVESAE